MSNEKDTEARDLYLSLRAPSQLEIKRIVTSVRQSTMDAVREAVMRCARTMGSDTIRPESELARLGVCLEVLAKHLGISWRDMP